MKSKENTEKKYMADTKILPDDEVKHIPLSDIYVDHDWNSRSRANVLSNHQETGDKEGTGIDGLTRGIFLDGQDTPVDVRSTKDAGIKTSKPWALVTGFRRFEAIRRLNDPKIKEKDDSAEGELSPEFGKLIEARKAEKKSLVPNTSDGTIRAVVRHVTEPEARLLNIRENTNRDDLTTPDLCLAVRELTHKHKMTPAQIIDRLGKSQGFVSNMIAIGKLGDDVLQHWRKGGEFKGHDGKAVVTLPSSVRANVRELVDISKEESAEKQMVAYTKLLQGKLPASSSADDNNQWMLSAKNKAGKIGDMLGTLQKRGFLEVQVENEEWADHIDTIVSVGNKEPSKRQAKAIAKAAIDAFTEALNREDKEEEEEAAE